MLEMYRFDHLQGVANLLLPKPDLLVLLILLPRSESAALQSLRRVLGTTAWCIGLSALKV